MRGCASLTSIRRFPKRKTMSEATPQSTTVVHAPFRRSMPDRARPATPIPSPAGVVWAWLSVGRFRRAIPVPEEASMPQYRSPGVYVEEKEAGSRPIEGVGTAVAAFVGIAADGPYNDPTLVTNWGQFTRTFGDFVPGSYLAHSVYGFFNNGGGACYIVRIGQNGAPPTARAE